MYCILQRINKHLTTYTARHTFATTVTLENDVPIETVSQMLGHKCIRTTQDWVQIRLYIWRILEQFIKRTNRE
ncbi:tyrosine-type recombinase/integrase [Chitinophaga sp. 22321]|uniref:Tyrosine-type recombinase/integrase n=1 Tax=Chitinophaga hostae TaxID=2831022 RepID=A0ABS5J955_9BACT|nr:tyrosine-type recombinase/integrase [Chitinophaga hostae]